MNKEHQAELSQIPGSRHWLGGAPPTSVKCFFQLNLRATAVVARYASTFDDGHDTAVGLTATAACDQSRSSVAYAIAA